MVFGGEVFQVFGNWKLAISAAGSYGGVNVSRRRACRDLVQKDLLSVVSIHCINVLLDSFLNRRYRSMLKQRGGDACGNVGIVILGKSLYPASSDRIKIGIENA